MTTATTNAFEIKPGDKVCVTGGNGYVGRHVTAALLGHGLRVVVTLRDLDRVKELRSAILAHLGWAEAPLEFIQADLLRDAQWDSAFAACSAVVHTASPFPNRQPKDPDTLIALAANGTERVMRIAHQMGVQRVVMTSSIAAITMKQLPPERAMFDESDWSNLEDPRCDPYAKSKLQSEQLAWSLQKTSGLALTTLQPGLAFGPPIGDSAGTSVGIVQRIFNGVDMAMPDAAFPCVDVRDVALAHLRALLNNATIGQRIILAHETLSMADIAKILMKNFPSRRIATAVAPAMMIRMAAQFDPVLKTILPHLGASPKVSSMRAQTLLSIDFRPTEAAILETVHSLLREDL